VHWGCCTGVLCSVVHQSKMLSLQPVMIKSTPHAESTAILCRRQELLKPVGKLSADSAYLQVLAVVMTLLVLTGVYIAIVLQWRSRTASRDNSLMGALQRGLRVGQQPQRKLH
jgi:hypothetical protein